MGWVVCKGDTLGNVSTKSLNTCLEKLLLGVINVGERVLGLLGTSCLKIVLVQESRTKGGKLTPSSTGTEKNSRPVSFAISSPPGTPLRWINVGVTIPFSPERALRTASANLTCR